MSKLYGQVCGDSKKAQTTTAHHFVRATAQSYDGSITTELHYSADGALLVEIRVCESSGVTGDVVFYGTIDKYIAKLTAKN